MTHMKTPWLRDDTGRPNGFTRPDGKPEVFTRARDLDFAEAMRQEQARQDEIRDTQGRIIWNPCLWIAGAVVLFWGALLWLTLLWAVS